MSDELILDGTPPVTVALRRHARARRMSLRISRIDGRVTLTLPPRAAVRDARAFLESQRDWLTGHLSRQQPNELISVGGQCLVEGRLLPVVEGTGRAARILEDAVTVPAAKADRAGALVEAALKLRARDRLSAASDHYAGRLGRRYSRLTLRDTRSRWGSCSSDAALMYSWRLIMAPPEVLNYVAAHEVAHLDQMNHSAAFWAIVARLMPGYEAQRVWLRRNGDQLHRWQFR